MGRRSKNTADGAVGRDAVLAMMLRRSGGYIALLGATALGVTYADSGVGIPLAVSGFCALAAVAIAWPEVRRFRVVATARIGGSVATAVLCLVCLTSIVVSLQVPCGTATTVGIGRGNIEVLHGTPLPPQVRWTWNSSTVTGLIPSWLNYGSFGWRGPSPSDYYFARSPGTIAIVVPTVILWLLSPRKIPAGCCLRCGYNLNGNVTGRCPECGTPTPVAPG